MGKWFGRCLKKQGVQKKEQGVLFFKKCLSAKIVIVFFRFCFVLVFMDQWVWYIIKCSSRILLVKHKGSVAGTKFFFGSLLESLTWQRFSRPNKVVMIFPSSESPRLRSGYFEKVRSYSFRLTESCNLIFVNEVFVVFTLTLFWRKDVFSSAPKYQTKCAIYHFWSVYSLA